MDKAKAAVGDFLSKSGKNDTTVHETVAPAVTKETIRPTQHEEVTTAVDREVHQDHHHTSVQPIAHKEILPEQHTHQVAGTEHRSYDHGTSDIKDKVAREAAQFKNERVVGDTQHTHSAAPTMVGEHTHHHVHETIQPVVQKETIQPNVVHTTVPVHEVHHKEAQHHSASALPAVSMDEFKKQGGTLGGREERTDGFMGEPKAIGGNLGSSNLAGGTTGTTAHTGTTRDPGLTDTVRDAYSTKGNSSGLTGSGATHGRDTTMGSGLTSSSGTTGTTGNTSTLNRTEDDIHGSTGLTGGSTSSTSKPSLMDKLNPKVDASGDGKAGFMK